MYKQHRRKRKKLKTSLWAILLAVMLLGTSGCGFTFDMEDSLAETSEEEDLIVVGFSQVGSESVWRTANTASIQNTLSKENGFFLLFNNARQKQENQIKAIRQFISQRVDYIVVSPMTEDGWETVLNEAKDAGIPVILVDRKVRVSDHSLYTTWIGSDMEEEGKKAGYWLADYEKEHKLTGEDINIVILKGTEGATATIGRELGFREVALQHENWHIIDTPRGDFTTAKGEEVMGEMLCKHEQIDVVISQNDDMTFGAIKAIESKGYSVGENGKIIMASFDGGREALELVQEGKINVDVECNPLQGPYVERIIDVIERGLAPSKNTKVEEMVFTSQNVAEYIDKREY